MTTERRRLLDKHLDTWIRSLQLDDVMLFLLAKSVFNEHIVDIIKVTTTHYLERLNPERNSRIPCKILRFFCPYNSLTDSRASPPRLCNDTNSYGS